MSSGPGRKFDLVLVGGGLANGLIALAVSQRHPDRRIVILDANAALGAGRTWSFHGTDVGAEARALLQPMIRSSWPRQEILFPGLRRSLSTSYHTIANENFEKCINRQANVELRLNTRVSEVTSDRVGCSDGTELTAACVIDGRGWEPNDTAHFALAYQKFFGLEIETDEPHGLDFPVIMDARVAQEDGYRFVYLLPYTDTAMLVEDTYYSDETTLDVARLSERVHAYVRHRGWSIKNVLARESGVLPIVLAGNVAAFHVADGMAPCSGVRAGLFHPLTGYSLPYAAGLAISIGRLPVLTSEAVRQLVRRQTDTLWRRHSFYRLLNRLLFAAASGAERRDVMQHFYRLPQALIERLYAGQSTSLDKFSVLVGRPPIPISRALKVVPEAAGWRYARGRRG